MEDININPVETADVTPDAEVETTVDETATVAEDTTPATETAETTERERAAAEATAAAESASSNASEAPITVPIRFNHETKALSLDEAATYAQKGMAAEPLMSKVRLLAAVFEETPAQALDKLINTHAEARKAEILEKVSGDETLANQLLEAEKSKYQKAVDEMTAAEKLADEQEKASVTDKLASDFIELQKEFPEILTVDKVPKSVISDAVNKNISLLDSMLRYDRKESKNIKAAIEKQQAAAQSSTGSVSSADNDGTSPEIEAMLQGLGR